MATALGHERGCFRAGGDDILTEGRLPLFELNPMGRDYGAAVDIGTTTVAAYLYRLSTGKLLKTLTENPQSVYGADVLSRLQKSIEGERNGACGRYPRLHIPDYRRVLRLSRYRPKSWTVLFLTGNTAMLYLLCGRDPQSIAVAPFEQGSRFRFLS